VDTPAVWAGETIVLTLLALVAFAANSLLNRMALAGHLIDATSYTAIRLASGAAVLGYAIWYRALRGLTAMQAGIVQLSVPVMAAAGAVVLLHEQVSSRLLVAGAAVLGGLALVLSHRRR
jgi:EamA domain-containing membrane protein RarD